jgi:hypothetical protein
LTRRPEPARPSMPSAARRSSVPRGLILGVATLIAFGGLLSAPAPPTAAVQEPAPADLVAPAAVPADTAWEGAHGSIDPTAADVPTTGDFLAAGGSVAGDAQFTYIAPGGGSDGESGQWSFFTTAAEDASFSLPWQWTGLHAWFNVTARLDAVIVRGETLVSSTNLVDAGPEICCTTPSNGFDYSGDASFTVQTGDVYGFVLAGSNGDFNDFLRGELTVGTQVPISCADAQALYGPNVGPDGRYVIHPVAGQRFSVHCADMDADGKDYLEVRSGSGLNVGQYAAGGEATGSTVTTSFTKLRLNPADLTVDVGDLTFATSVGGLNHPDAGLGNPLVEAMPYATAMGCAGAVANASANIDLQGTPFAVDDTFVFDDPGIGSATFSALDQVVSITGGGFCGWTAPEGTAFNPFNPTPGQYILDLRYLNAPEVGLSTPVLFASIAREASTADLYVLVDGAENLPVTVEVRRSTSCIDGVLGASTVAGTATLQTDASGYVLFEGVSGIAPGDYVTVAVTAPTATSASTCVRTTADNDTWPKALTLGSSSTLTAQDVVEIEGRARWYRFPIVPDQQITVKLSGLPADYDLAVFRDIATEFESQVTPSSSDDLNRLSAEFAPSVFSPSVFSPSVFSPSVFSPDAYAPSVFSPSVFSPSVFSPSVFSPSVFSPSVFSPSVFSPSVFSPSVFSPSVFSPSVFSPSVFSPSVFSDEEIAQAFSSAQTRSLIGVSATPGTGDETVVVNSWNNTGHFYVRVAGHGGAFDSDDLFNVTVTKAPSSCEGVTDTTISDRGTHADAGDFGTVILTDSSRLVDDGSAAALVAALDSLAQRAEVDGVIVDLAGDDRVQELWQQASSTANVGCPFAMNLVAEEIKSIVDSYRDPSDADALRYVTIVGGDTVIPFFRYPDQSRLGQESQYFPPTASDTISEASLRRDYVLSQDAYGAGVTIDIRTNAFPVPGLAVGRLVETPTEILNMIGAYVETDGVVAPTTSLVTGYDFLTDAADAVVDELQDGGTSVNELITDADVSPQRLLQPGDASQRDYSWTAHDLRRELLGDDRHDVVYLAGHFSAQSALAADYDTSVLTSELVASDTDLRNTLVFSGGCHSGYNLLDGHALATTSPLDWAQAFAQKGAVLVAGTGYQYGDTDFLEYSERLYRDFSQELRAGQSGTAVSVGEALMHAKRTYLATTPDIRGIHEKAILEATLFGLPMFGVNMPGGRGATPGTGGGTVNPTEITDGPAGTLGGLAAHDLEFVSSTTPKSLDLDVIESTGVTGTVTASWLEGPAGVVTNPAEPAIPKHVVPVTSDNPAQVLRGVGWRGGTYTDVDDVLPLTGAPTTELRGVHAPFVSPVFYPMRMWTPNYFGALSGSGGTNLIVTPVQHRTDDANPGRSVRRAFADLDLRLYYSSNLTEAALSDAPTIVNAESTATAGGFTVRAQVIGNPNAAIHEAWIVWTDGDGPWQPLDLQQCTAPLTAECGGLDDSRFWAGTIPTTASEVQYVVQAVSGVGLVAFDDNLGRYHTASTTAPQEPVPTMLELVDPPAGGTFGDSTAVTVELTSSGAPLANQQVVVQVGGAGGIGVTGADGRATVTVALNSTPGTTDIVASYGGSVAYLPSGAAAAFSIAKAPAQFGDLTPFLTTTEIGQGRALTTLTAELGDADQPLIQRTVTVTLTGPESRTLSVITNYLGEVTLPVDVAPGGYTVTLEFAGDETYEPATATDGISIIAFDLLAPIDGPPTVNVVKAGATVPIKFSLGGDHGMAILDGTPTAVKYGCESGVREDAVETVSSGSSGLQFSDGIYQYNWKTAKAFKGSCYRFTISFVDGSSYTALFRFN